mgnify:CR=1 FL=1
MTWFHITHKNGVALVNIFGAIGVGATAEELIAELLGATTVELRIETPGGSGKTALKIYDALRERNTSAEIIGRCYSAGFIIVMAAKRIKCASSGRLMIHPPACFVLGNAGQLRAAADDLEKDRERCEQIISDRSGQPLETVRFWARGETYFSPEEALFHRLVDEIYTAPEVPAAPAIAANVTPGAAPVTESEEMFRAWLKAFGPITVASKREFLQDVAGWLLVNVAERQA